MSSSLRDERVFTGSISSPRGRFPLDLFNLAVSGSMPYLLGSAVGARKLVYKMRKTLAASTIIIAQKLA